jgi:hypothetical protein
MPRKPVLPDAYLAKPRSMRYCGVHEQGYCPGVGWQPLAAQTLAAAQAFARWAGLSHWITVETRACPQCQGQVGRAPGVEERDGL